MHLIHPSVLWVVVFLGGFGYRSLGCELWNLVFLFRESPHFVLLYSTNHHSVQCRNVVGQHVQLGVDIFLVLYSAGSRIDDFVAYSSKVMLYVMLEIMNMLRAKISFHESTCSVIIGIPLFKL